MAAYAEPGTIEAGTRDGHYVNSCWFEIGAVRYFLSYFKGIGRIREGGKKGPIVFEFTQRTTAGDTYGWFDGKDPVPVHGTEEPEAE